MSKLDEILQRELKLPANGLEDALTMQDVASWDSLAHMDLIGGLEAEFGIELSADDIVEMTSIGAIREALSKHGVTG